jgi:hypothetical protein
LFIKIFLSSCYQFLNKFRTVISPFINAYAICYRSVQKNIRARFRTRFPSKLLTTLRKSVELCEGSFSNTSSRILHVFYRILPTKLHVQQWISKYLLTINKITNVVTHQYFKNIFNFFATFLECLTLVSHIFGHYDRNFLITVK